MANDFDRFLDARPPGQRFVPPAVPEPGWHAVRDDLEDTLQNLHAIRDALLTLFERNEIALLPEARGRGVATTVLGALRDWVGGAPAGHGDGDDVDVQPDVGVGVAPDATIIGLKACTIVGFCSAYRSSTLVSTS